MSTTPTTLISDADTPKCSWWTGEDSHLCKQAARWKKDDATEWTGYLCDTCYSTRPARYQMEYKWIGPLEEDPKNTFTCQPGQHVNVFRHADPCTCGDEFKSIIDDLEKGYQATVRFRAIICRDRGSAICSGLGWDDIDGVTLKISRLQDKILTNLSSMRGGPIIKKRKIADTDTEVVAKKQSM